MPKFEKFDKHIYPSVHKGIVQAALLVLEAEQHPATKRFTAGDAETLIEYASAPDRVGDRQKGRGLHYYCAVLADGTPLAPHPVLQGYCNAKRHPAPSPLTMMDAEYRAAISLYRAGKFVPAMQSLTRALHMLADICCPPHTCTLTYFSIYGLKHKRYESRAAEIFWGKGNKNPDMVECAQVWAEQASGTVPYARYTGLLRGTVPKEDGTWQAGRLTEICNELALSGAEELKATCGDDAEALDESIRRRLVLSVAQCAAMLAAFDHDVGNSRLSCWEERHPYWLKGFGTAFVVSKEPLYLHFEEDGAVTLSTQEGRYLAVHKSGRVELTDETAELTTCFRFGREPLLTLYPDGDQNRLLVMLRGKLLCLPRAGRMMHMTNVVPISFTLINQPPEHARYVFE